MNESPQLISAIAQCPNEVRELVISELEQLGATSCVLGYRCVHFSCSLEIFYKCHLVLRNTSSILRVIKKFPYQNLTIFSSRIYKIKWQDYITKNKSYALQGIIGQKSPNLPNSSDITSRAIKAIEHKFINQKSTPPKYSSKEPNINIHIHLDAKQVHVCLQTSGKALHKRGYRISEHVAPLKETLAASLLDLIGYHGQAPLCDPMSGSGTITIEGSYLALNKAVQIHRKKNEFSLEHLKDFDPILFRNIQEDLREQKKEQCEHPIYAWDIDTKSVELSKKNALRARVEKHITFECSDFFNKKPPHKNGYLIANLPYAKRLSANTDMTSFYKKIGDHLKQNYQGWKIGLLVADDTPWKFIGLKPQKKIPLKNGSVKTKFLIFEIYQGSKKTPE
jgi:putative N6-adenine-specific DNA methylase